MLNTAQNLFKIFSDKNRLRIFKLLERNKMCVCELAHVIGVTQPSISRHLKKMKDAGLIDSEQDGFWTNYYLRKGNPSQESVLRCVKSLLNDDEMIKRDLETIKATERSKLCGR